MQEPTRPFEKSLTDFRKLHFATSAGCFLWCPCVSKTRGVCCLHVDLVILRFLECLGAFGGLCSCLALAFLPFSSVVLLAMAQRSSNLVLAGAAAGHFGQTFGCR